MKPRFDPSQPPHGRYYADRHTTPLQPRCPIRSSKPYASHPVFADTAKPAHSSDDATSPFCPKLKINLADEVSASELNDFAYCVLKVMADLDDKGTAYSTEDVLHESVTEKLKSYVALKSDFQASHEAKKEYHQWAKQLMSAAEPLLKNKTIPDTQIQDLSTVAVQCVEKTMQLKMRAECLRQRVAFLEQTVPEYLAEYAKQLGHTDPFCRDLAEKTRRVLEQY